MKPQRNLWPYGIMLTFALFLSGTVGLVVMACSQKEDLVSSNYYEQELKFQKQIDRVNRTQNLAAQALVTYDANAKRIAISLPAVQGLRGISGTIDLYRPSAAGLDRRLDLNVDDKGCQLFDAASLVPGLWKVRISWSANGQDYYTDQKVVIDPA